MNKEVFLGLSLGGIKFDKSSLVELEYFKKEKRLVLSQVQSKFTGDFPDESIKSAILKKSNLRGLGVDFPTSLPSCLSCRLDCPGVQKCSVKEVKWLRREYKRLSKIRKVDKFPSPYSERGLDFFIAKCLDEEFPLEPTLGASRASFYGRGVFLKKALKKVPIYEVFPKASLWRFGLRYGIRKSVLRNFFKSGLADENRETFLSKLDDLCFMYDADRRKLLKSKESFVAFICALSVYIAKYDSVELVPEALSQKGLRLALPVSAV